MNKAKEMIPEVESWAIPRSKGLGFKLDDGGRSAAGFKGSAGDCVTRAIAIAEFRDYNEVREELMAEKRSWMAKSRSRSAKKAKSASVRNGTEAKVYRPYLEKRGWVRKTLVKFGDPSRKKMVPEEIPLGNVIVEIPKHVIAIKDHVVHDTFDSRTTNVWEDGVPTEKITPRTMVAFWVKEPNKPERKPSK